MSQLENLKNLRSLPVATAVLTAAFLYSGAGSAQTDAPAEPAAEPAPEPPPPPAEPAPPAAAPAEPAPAAFTITTGFGVRFGAQMQSLRRSKRMDTFNVDEIYVEPRFSGKVLDFVGWTANLAVFGSTPASVIANPVLPPAGPPVAFEARAMDLIAQLDFMDEFHLWGGRMLTPSDRSNFSGPWFMSPWDYPGLYSVPSAGPPIYVGPRGTEEIGREVGAVAWGDIEKGMLKYYVGIMDLDNTATNTPLYTGRVGYAILGAEPGFYGSSTYYGSQNIVAVGLGAQYQKRFVLGTLSDDLFEINADLLAEFNVEGVGTLTGEGAFYHVDSGDSAGVMPYDDAFFITASYLTADTFGVGKIQPLFRYQAAYNDDGGPDLSMIEAQVSYVMKDYFAKLSLGYQHTDMDNDIVGNAIQFGFQIQQ